MFGGIGRGVSSALNVFKVILAKVALVLALLALLFQLLTMISGSSGGISSSIIMSPYEGSDGKLDLGPYYTILDDEWNEYMNDLHQWLSSRP